MNPSVLGEVGEIVSTTITSINNYLINKEIQETERKRIRATLQAITEKYKNDREMFEMYLERSFFERSKLYETGQALLGKSINENDLDTTKLALNFILQVYNKNPLEGFQLDKSPLDINILSNSL